MPLNSPAVDRVSTNSTAGPDISLIHRLIRRTRVLLRSTWVLTGIGVAAGLFLAALIAVSLTDLLIAMWPSFRLAGLLIIVVPTVWAVIVGVLRPLFRRLSAVLIARRIEAEIPGIHNRLVSCVDLSREQEARTRSPAFYQRLVREALERIRGFHPRKVLDLISLRRAVMFAVVNALGLLLAFVVFNDRLPTAVARIFRPFADIPPATGVIFEVLADQQTVPGDHETLRGEDVVFHVTLKKGDVPPPGRPGALRLEIQGQDDEGRAKTLWYDLAALENTRTDFKLTGMQHSFRYRVHGGGTWTPSYRVVMLDRPRILELQTAVHYPEYMRDPEPRVSPPQTADVSGPIDSRVEVTVNVGGDAAEGEIQLLEERVRQVDVLDRPERLWFDGSLPEGARAEGNWQWDEPLAGRKTHFDPAADGAHGHGFVNAPIPFEVSPGETLFAYVFLPADQMPQAIMIKWHDGSNWEHRAFWGEDKIGEGTLATPSRLRVGDLPASGKLVRLEVPARDVQLDGRRLKGIHFATFGGRALWGATGALPGATRDVRELAVTESFLLNPVRSDAPSAAVSPSAWRGSFPITRNGFYRLELRNRLGYANQRMEEGRILAIRDNPPQVGIERPGTDLVVSTPVKVPVYLSAFDDFGLDKIVLSIQSGSAPGFTGRPVKQFAKPPRSDSSIVTIDLEAEQVTLGKSLKYRVEVLDVKGQTASTQDYTIRVANDNNAADKQLAQFQEKTDQFQTKLEQLIAEQNKVQQALEKLEEKYEPLTEKVQKAQAELAQAEQANPPQPPKPDQPLPLDPQAVQELQQLRNELAEVAKTEDQAIQLGQQVAAEMNQLSQQANQLQMLPPELGRQLQATQQSFDQTAVKPLQDLSQMMKQAAQPARNSPQLPAIEQQGELVQENLEQLQERLEALARATKMTPQDPAEALAGLQRDFLQMEAGRQNRSLSELRDFVEAMREEIGELGKEQVGLLEDTSKDLSERVFEILKQEQVKLDDEAEASLDEAKELLASDDLRRVRGPAPLPQSETMKADAKKTPAEDAKKSSEKKGADGDKKADVPLEKKAEKGSEPPPQAVPIDPDFQPALGGKEPAGEPDWQARLEKARATPVPQSDRPEGIERAEFRERQLDLAQDLSAAERALASDQRTLEALLAELAKTPETEQRIAPEQAEKLAELLNSAEMERAQAMRDRMEEMQRELPAAATQVQNPTNAQLPPPAPPTPEANLEPVNGGVEKILVELNVLDVNARTALMKMQPRDREELLQALREEGPEGYRQFIREYFRQLTKVQATKK